jgi:dihydroneopterin aldolase
MNKTTITLKDIAVSCILGVSEEERSQQQEVLITVRLTIDAAKASQSDSVEDTVNYKEVYLKIIEQVQQATYHLLEALCRHLCEVCLQYPQVQEVVISVTKPHRLPQARGVTVEMEQKKYE